MDYAEKQKFFTEAGERNESIKNLLKSEVESRESKQKYYRGTRTSKIVRIERVDEQHDGGYIEKVYTCLFKDESTGILMRPPRGINVGDTVTYTRTRLPYSSIFLIDIFHKLDNVE